MYQHHRRRNDIHKHIIANENTSDNIYYNIDITNKGEVNFKKAIFEQTRDNSILQNARDYYLSVVRFHIPAYTMPLFINPVHLGQSDLNESALSITLDHNGDIFQQYITYYPGTFLTPPNVSGTITEQPDTRYYEVFDYQHLIDMVNTAFSDAFAGLSAPPATSAPVMILDKTNKFFSIIVEDAFYNINTVAPANLIKIYFNFDFQSFFTGMPVRTGDGLSLGRDVQLMAKYNFNNYYQIPNSSTVLPAELIEMRQQIQTIQTLNPIKNIFFQSNLFPIKGELTKVNDSYRKVITDFEPLTNSDNEIRTDYQFYVQGKLRLIDILSDAELKKIDFQVYWIDMFDYVHLLDLPKYTWLTVKILFIKKSLEKNYNEIYE